jgi:hypothetical protein
MLCCDDTAVYLSSHCIVYYRDKKGKSIRDPNCLSTVFISGVYITNLKFLIFVKENKVVHKFAILKMKSNFGQLII